MNVSRSGRVRKKSKFLLDSEFHTPKESVIQGLSELDSKFSRSTPSSHLISVDTNNGHHELSDKSKLEENRLPILRFISTFFIVYEKKCNNDSDSPEMCRYQGIRQL